MLSGVEIRFYGLDWEVTIPLPPEIELELAQADSPEAVEVVIRDRELQLAQLFDPGQTFLCCDSATELMADVLRSKQIPCEVVCGVNDWGDAHSYVQVAEKKYDPTGQGFGP